MHTLLDGVDWTTLDADVISSHSYKDFHARDANEVEGNPRL